jgi:hypothetical protein
LKQSQRQKKINLKDVVPFRVENHDALVEVVVLHGGGRVEDGQGRFHLRLERVVRPAVVQVVAKARDQQTEYLKIKKKYERLRYLQIGYLPLGFVNKNHCLTSRLFKARNICFFRFFILN